MTVAALLIAYPVAYWIAFYGGRFKSVFLFLLLLPFFISFVIRTVAWSFILSDDGIVLGTLKSIGLLPEGYHVLGTTFAVVAGITYNLVPFTILPLYVSLEQIDHRAWSRRRRTCTRAGGRRSSRWCSACRCPACSRRSCSPRSPRSATT